MANVIIIITPTSIESWSNFKKMCEEKKLPYHSLKMKPFPIIWGEYEIQKLKVN